MQRYKTWSFKTNHPPEVIEAATSFEARKAFACKHGLSVFDVMARRIDVNA